jgi:hypothetical protein
MVQSPCFTQTHQKHLILGAGFVGLGMAQALKVAGIPYDQVEARDRLGGNWSHGVYESAHIISSKRVTQFPQFPMPDHYPDFPSAAQMLAYLEAFAAEFGLTEQIAFNCTVQWVRPVEDNRWEVTLENGDRHCYQGVLLCNGHHWCKTFPDLPGSFQGPILHSKDYKHPEQLRDRRVLVIGGGNSACDIAAEAARVGRSSLLSLRDSPWFIPKTFAGIPMVDLPQWWVPEALQRLMTHTAIRLSFGSHQSLGLAPPRHRLFSKHPTLNNEVPYYLKHGRIQPRPPVHCLDGNQVEFTDGQRDPVDLIICATGYQLAYPFLPPALQRVKGATVQCYGGTCFEDYRGLYFLGWGQARGGVGSLMGAYGPLFAKLLKLQASIQVPLGLVFKQLGQPLPTTHLSDPQALFRAIALAQACFPWLEFRARQINRQYPTFQNVPLEPV